MDPIPDLTADCARSWIRSRPKGSCRRSPPRGTGRSSPHALYLPEEMEKVRRQMGEMPAQQTAAADHNAPVAAPRPSPAAPRAEAAAQGSTSAAAAAASSSELTALRARAGGPAPSVAQLRADLANLTSQSHQNTDELDRLRRSLGE